jgi:hypothetical protein
MPGKRKQRCAAYKCQILPEPHSEPATFQIATHVHDDGVYHEAMDDHCAQGGYKSDEEGTQYRDAVRRCHFAYAARRVIPTSSSASSVMLDPRAPNEAGGIMLNWG